MLTNEQKFNAIIIGLGRIGVLLEDDKLRLKPCTHWGGIMSISGFVLTGAWDKNKNRLKAFCKKNSLPVKKTISELFSDKHIDLAIISTDTDEHYPVIKEIVNYSPSIVLCEKPIAQSTKIAKKIIMLCRNKGIRLVVNHERRFSKKYNYLKFLIDNNILGRVKTISAKVLTNYNKKKGLSILHDGTHLIDILNYYFSNMKLKESFRVDIDSFYALFSIQNRNLIIFTEFGGNRRYFEFFLDIFFEKARVIIGNGIEKLYIAKKSKKYDNFTDLNTCGFYTYQKKWFNLYFRKSSITNFSNIKKNKEMLILLNNFDVNENVFISMYYYLYWMLKDKNIKNISSGEDALKVLKIIDLIKEKAKTL